MVKILVIGSAIAIAGVWLLQFRGLLARFQSPSQPKSSAQVLRPITIPPLANHLQSKDAPRSLKLRLTLDSPYDLKVKQGETVFQGQVISDRPSVRNQLAAQQRSLLIKFGQLKQQGTVLTRPIPSYAIEQARIEAARLRVKQAEAAIQNFWRRSPYTQAAWNLLPLEAEKVKLTTLEARLNQAQVDYKLSVAQLQTVRDKDQLAIFRNQRQHNTSQQREQVLAQLKEVEDKLTRLEVRSPYAGTVKRIKWLGQIDHELQVEVIMTIASGK
jgi:biotin carboxyl carrier protein